jgi:hypothetical protein
VVVVVEVVVVVVVVVVRFHINMRLNPEVRKLWVWVAKHGALLYNSPFHGRCTVTGNVGKGVGLVKAINNELSWCTRFYCYSSPKINNVSLVGETSLSWVKLHSCPRVRPTPPHHPAPPLLFPPFTSAFLRSAFLRSSSHCAWLNWE